MTIESGPSIEGAYDKAIEAAARRIQLASRPIEQTNIGKVGGADHDRDNIDTTDSTNEETSSVLSETQEESSTTSSSNSSVHKKSDDGTCNSSADYDTGSEHDSIESNILFLKEKTLILKKAQSIRKNEQAFVAFYAYKILNDQHKRPASGCSSSSIWSEAKDIIDEYKSGLGGNNEEDDDGEITNAFLHNEKHRLSSSPLQQRPSSTLNRKDNNLSSSSAAVSERFDGSSHLATGTTPNKKRPKIDLSSVEHISSTKFDSYDDKHSDRKFCDISATNICRQAHDMQFATDSRNWISKAVLTDILSLTKNLVAKYRLSLVTPTKKRKRG